jgi:hypothetical protein
MLYYCVNNYCIAKFALVEASLKTGTDPGPVISSVLNTNKNSRKSPKMNLDIIFHYLYQ